MQEEGSEGGFKCLFVTLNLQGRETCVKFLYLGIDFFFHDLSVGKQDSLCGAVVHLSCEGYLVNFEQMKHCSFFPPFFDWLCVPYRVWKVSEIIYM